MIDLGPLDQPVEKGLAAIVAPQHGAPEIQENLMHIVRRHGRGNAVDVGLCHVVFRVSCENASLTTRRSGR